MAPSKGTPPPNKLDRTGKRYGKLEVLRSVGGGKWFCICDCGNTPTVQSGNFANYAKNNRGCASCANRQDITGERRGLLVALSVENGPVKGRHPLWLFQCDCGNTIRTTVRKFRFNWIRSCGCMGSAWTSWSCMMDRCYNETNTRYKHYGERGIKVCDRWHNFDNFVADMGERPKDHTLSRKRCEESYEPGNCIWEHITKNTADTCFGMPTKPGLKKGAVPRTPARNASTTPPVASES